MPKTYSKHDYTRLKVQYSNKLREASEAYARVLAFEERHHIASKDRRLLDSTAASRTAVHV